MIMGWHVFFAVPHAQQRVLAHGNVTPAGKRGPNVPHTQKRVLVHRNSERQRARTNRTQVEIRLKEPTIMTHDPFQTYANLGQHGKFGIPVPIGLQYPSLQTSVINPTAAINPLAAMNPLLGLSPIAQAGGIPQLQLGQLPYGQIPNQGLVNQQQQLQLASLLATQPQLASLLATQPQLASLLATQPQLASLLATQPLLTASLLSNPLIAASLHSQALGAYVVPQFGLQQPTLLPQQIGPYGVPQFGLQQPTLLPQQIGQMGSPFGQIGSLFGQIGYPLAPQSWIGQGGQFGGVPVYPFQSQLGPRPFQGLGSPWGY